MKNLYHIVLLFILVLISGCSKSGSNSTNSNYTVTGVSDITVRQYADTTVTALYHVAFPAGIYEPVTINIGDLPPGVTVSPGTATDTTSFLFQVTYHILITAAASFPVTVTIFSGSFGKKSFTFNIIVTPGTPFAYTLSGLHDINVPLYADTTLRVPITATYNAGINENVTIAADGLPTGVTVSPTTVTGLPAFTDTFAFHIAANTIGAFPVTIHTTSSQGTKESTFIINVNAGTDCAPPLAGNYSGNTVCTSYTGAGTGISPCTVTVTGTDKLLINVPFAYLSADLNCSSTTLNTGPTTNGGITISGGTGTFNATTIIVNYTLAGSINSSCTTTLTR
ncbi:MAG: hypothetical protein ACHQD8_05025 [Chitinophagales bacterium]